MSGQKSYCVQCDSEVNPCPDHPKSPRYLDDIVYEKVPTGGWKVPEEERERWENPPALTKRTFIPQPTKSIQRLIVELEGWIYLTEEVEQTIRSAYEKNPSRVSRLVEKVVDDARRPGDDGLSNPQAYLMKHARDIASQ